MGGETAIWTEQASDSDILTRIFPRSWAYAERLWTNPSKGTARVSLEYIYVNVIGYDAQCE